MHAVAAARDQLGANGPVVFVTQSLGCQVLSNYLYDAQRPVGQVAAGIWRDIDVHSQDIAGHALSADEIAFLRGQTVQYWVTTGCSIPAGSLAQEYLQRTLLNLIGHPNVGGILFVGLGCEVNQLGSQVEAHRGQSEDGQGACQIGPYLTVQEQGGIEATITAGRQAVWDMLPQVNLSRRVPVPLSSLKIALQCGGSDGWSGVTANPLIGKVADQVVAAGGTVVLSETPAVVLRCFPVSVSRPVAPPAVDTCSSATSRATGPVLPGGGPEAGRAHPGMAGAGRAAGRQPG